MKVGQDIAPDFTLLGTLAGEITLSNLRGKKSVVLIFYLMDSTPG